MAYPIRPLSIGEILDIAFRLLRDRWRPLLAISVVFWLPVTLFENAVHSQILASPEHERAAFVFQMSSLAIDGLAFAPYYAAMTIVLNEAYLGRSIGFADALQQMWPMLFRFALTSLVASTLAALGLVLLVFPGILIMLNLLLLDPVMVAEKVSGVAAMRRSRELMRHSQRRGIALLFLVLVLTVAVGYGASWPLDGVPIADTAMTHVMMMLAVSFTGAVYVVFYYDVICRREAFDIEHLAQRVDAQSVA